MKLEEQLLPHPDLKPLHDEAVWVYVYQTFAGDRDDRAAERIAIRFGVSSWPQLMLVDPAALTIRTHTGRTVASFHAAFEGTRSAPRSAAQAAARALATLRAEARAVRLEVAPTLQSARQGLDDTDIVVRTRALAVLARREPQRIVARAAELLRVPSDPFRYRVCQLLREAADPGAKDALEALVREPAPSLNPNVLRIRAVQALATCGDAASIPVVAPHAASGVYFNGLTGVAIATVVAILERHPEAREDAFARLRAGYPQPPAKGDARALRACTALARRIHAAVEDPRPFPAVYDAAARAVLMEKPR